MRVRIKTSLDYGAFDAELEDGITPESLFDEKEPLAKLSVWVEDGARVVYIIRKKHIQGVEVIE